MELNQLSYQIIKAAINVHKELGPGLLESVYQFTLGQEAARFTDKFQRGCTKRRAM
ncbi:MAG: GxxExxY protein [Desulfobacterales bacterium]|jgi:GxxExxY protein